MRTRRAVLAIETSDATAAPGEYALAVEAGTDTSDERIVSEATVTVEG